MTSLHSPAVDRTSMSHSLACSLAPNENQSSAAAAAAAAAAETLASR